MAEAHPHCNFLGYRVYRTQRVMMQCLEKWLDEYDLTPAQWNALNQLEHSGPLSQRRLADLLHREPATITRSIDKMERAGLVERVADPHDRRTNLITLKPAAGELLARIQPVAAQAAIATQGDLTDDEAALLISLLDRVYENCSDILGMSTEDDG